MAVRFEAAGDRLEIHQTRRVLRIVTWIFVLFGIGGALVINAPHSAKVTIACSRSGGTCTIGHPHSKDWKQPLAEITGVKLTDGELMLERKGMESYHLCAATRLENEAAAKVLTGFFADPMTDQAATECTSHLPGLPIAGRLAGLAGMALLYFLLTAFLVDAHTVIDRKARTIAMRGSSWPLKKWSFERPLADVEGVSSRKIYTGRGQYMYLVDVVFTDGERFRALSPAAYKIQVLQERIMALRRFLGLSNGKTEREA